MKRDVPKSSKGNYRTWMFKVGRVGRNSINMLEFKIDLSHFYLLHLYCSSWCLKYPNQEERIIILAQWYYTLSESSLSNL